MQQNARLDAAKYKAKCIIFRAVCKKKNRKMLVLPCSNWALFLKIETQKHSKWQKWRSFSRKTCFELQA